MSLIEKPKDFKFEENRFSLNIEAKGKEDGQTISSKLATDIHCEGEFARNVIHNFFDKDSAMEKLFKEVITERSLVDLFGGSDEDDTSDEDLVSLVRKLKKTVVSTDGDSEN